MSLYTHTFISPYVTPAVYLFAGCIGILFYFRKMPPHNKAKTKDILVKLIFCFTVGGGLITWPFLGLNYYITNNEPITKIFPIAEHGSYLDHVRGGLYPMYVTFKYNKSIKELPFGSREANGISGYKFVQMEISKGLFGFEVIKRERLIDIDAP